MSQSRIDIMFSQNTVFVSSIRSTPWFVLQICAGIELKCCIYTMYNVQCRFIHTALRNHNRTVFEEMTSWTALTWYIGMKTEF